MRPTDGQRTRTLVGDRREPGLDHFVVGLVLEFAHVVATRRVVANRAYEGHDRAARG